MKNVVLIPGNTDLNRGDEALVWESISIINDVYNDDVDISIVGTKGGSEEDILQTRQTKALGYDILEPILRHPSKGLNSNSKEITYSRKTLLIWGIIALKDLFFSLLLLSKSNLLVKWGIKHLDDNQRETLDKIKKSDAIFVKGGGFIHSYGDVTDGYRLYYLIYLMILAQHYNKDVYVLPNSIGPLNNRIAYHIVKAVLKKCKLITVRESISQDYLSSIGITSYRFPDLGFYLQPSEFDFNSYLKNKGVNLEKQNVLITLRPYRFSGHKNPTLLFKNYENSVIRLIEHLVKNEYGVTLFAHTLGPGSHEDDKLAIEGVINKLPSSIKSSVIFISDYDLTCRDVEKIYSYYDFLIGTRFHSVIFSLNVNVPAIAIAYGGNKGKGIMEDLQNDKFSVDMDKLSEDSLIELFNKLKDEKDLYLNNLILARDAIVVKRKELIELLKDLTD